MEKKKINIEALLNYREIIEVLVEYDVIHQEFVLNRWLKNKNKKEYIGFFDSEDTKIFIDTKQCLKEKRKAIIHELLHVKNYLKGIDDTEKRIEKDTTIIYNSLYGQKKK